MTVLEVGLPFFLAELPGSVVVTRDSNPRHCWLHGCWYLDGQQWVKEMQELQGPSGDPGWEGSHFPGRRQDSGWRDLRTQVSLAGNCTL